MDWTQDERGGTRVILGYARRKSPGAPRAARGERVVLGERLGRS